MMFRCLILIAVTALLSACAKPPHQEIRAAEYMVSRAELLQASEFAPSEYQAASTALNDAHKAMQEGDYGEARDSLEFSLEHARRAVSLAEQGHAKRAEQEAQRALAAEKARQAALKAQTEQPPRKVAAPSPPSTKPEPPPKPKITPATSYTVGDGENLWTISAQPQVYDEGLLWPLLYQANRDQIKDPRQIFPGQVLSIRRDMTQMDLDEARQKARESDIFPLIDVLSPKQ